MTRKINFGIDLGTTNSAIAVYRDGKVNVLRNPRGFREVLPSAIAFRKGRILVGDKARESGEALYTAFKRDMGSDIEYHVGEEKYSPLSFSTLVLEQLRGFQPEPGIETAVITIPASFDIVQSNATKKAGYAAGLKEVVLLQEPIAACLAYANENNLDITSHQRWLVYDFGGGTFDCALVEINNREMTVLDHQGNNFLGGIDMDESVLRDHILPALKNIEDIDWPELIKTSHDVKKQLLLAIEEAKIELTQQDTAHLEIELDEPEFYGELTLNRAQFNASIDQQFQASWQLMEGLIGRNGLGFSDISRIVLVGGTTYIPYIREELKNKSGIEVDSSIDPGTAVVKGAAYFAGSKDSTLEDEENISKTSVSNLKVTLSYESNTLDDEELVAFKVHGGFSGSYLIRQKESEIHPSTSFHHEASVFIPIQPKQLNEFELIIKDEAGTVQFSQQFIIIHGNYSVNGQTLPSDICLELDDAEEGTKLEPIFRKNALLPIKRTVFRTVNKNIASGSEDALYINVLEGNAGTLPASNLSIGFIEIKGAQLSKDLIKGMDIELQFQMSESRDLQIDVYIPNSQKHLSHVFNPHQKSVNLNKLTQELEKTIEIIKEDLEETEPYDIPHLQLQALLEDVRQLLSQCREGDQSMLQKLDEEKRALLKQYDNYSRLNKLASLLESYKLAILKLKKVLDEANALEKEQAQKILQKEWEVQHSDNRHVIQEATNEVYALFHQLFFKNDANYVQIFYWLNTQSEDKFKDIGTAGRLFNEGHAARENGDIQGVKHITIALFNLLKPSALEEGKMFGAITGIR